MRNQLDEVKLTSIEKSIMILEILGSEPYCFKPVDLAKKLGFNRSSVYRILQTLLRSDLVILDQETDMYKIGPGMYHIGMTYLYRNSFMSKINDILAEISEITKESVGMAVKDGDKIISLFEIEVHQPMKLNDVPGRYFPVNKGNYGKCIMAYQPIEYIHQILNNSTFEKSYPNTLTTKEEILLEYENIRCQGYSMSIDELGIDIIGTGIPIFDARGKIKACVAVAFFRDDGWKEKLIKIKDILLSYQHQLERYMP